MVIIQLPGGTLGDSPGLPGGSLGLQGHGRRLGGKIMQSHCVFLTKVDSPTILAESGEGDPHDLRSLRTKVEGHSDPDLVDQHRALHQTVRTPTVENCLGKYKDWICMTWKASRSSVGVLRTVCPPNYTPEH